ncbi:hypothetical protein L6452_20821 [Arctium lappa]|uniref:Uncharacterized protein n=1 Tax=Arctium lappa TaxID=4217 RepID=A0ACB9BCH4_ARCLA|nr:hypothetical protein L6452_20821 [Arctium lappa]
MAGGAEPPNKKSDAPDPNSPFYIHASDYPKQMHVNDNLTDSNYADWSQEMMNFLFAKNKVGFVDGTIEKPEKTHTNYMLWMRCDVMVKGWLTTAMERDIRGSVKYANTASEIWADLQERFGKESAPRAYELKQTLASTHQNGASVSTYYTKLRAIWDEMQAALPLPRCTCSGCKCDVTKNLSQLRDKEKLYEFLMGLDNEFSVIRIQILATNLIPSLGNAYHLVTEDERQRSISNDKRPSVEAAAFKTTMLDGHSKEGCFKRIGYPEWWPGNKRRTESRPKASCVDAESSPIPGLSTDQYRTFLKHFEEKEGTNRDRTKPTAYMTGKRDVNDDWVVDSGSTEHIVHNDSILENITKTRFEKPVLIPNGDVIPVEGKGSCFLPGGTKLNGVLHIPKFTCNLLSVSRICKDLQCAVTFFPDFCVMQKLYTKNLIGAGECKRGLYRMGVFEQSRKAMVTTGDIWHKRLGHASNEKLTKIESLSSFSFNKQCDSCSKSKRTRLPFSNSEIKTSGCFELLHCDIWGKYRTLSLSGAGYFLTIVDDFSRVVWVFLLKFKHEASKHLMNFHKMIKNQFDRSIKKIRCDNGGEFTSNDMLNFYNEEGIKLETSCPHTPQQNGVVERKHRHLLETARALRFQANLPKRFWGECILTATYIINRLPSRVIDNKTPYEIVFGQRPDYDFMKVFGCLAYYGNTETKGDKFEMKGRPGIFLGYPTGSKGYKIYDIEKRRMVVSRDVRFHETKFPFTETENQTSQGDCFDETMSYDVNDEERGLDSVEDQHTSSSDDSEFLHDNEAQHMHEVETEHNTTTFLAAIDSIDEPKYLHQAVKDERWKDAMKREVRALEENNTWTIEDLPEGKRAIDSKWVYKVKYKPNGEVERFKARLVAKGFTQMEGVDYHDTFAPVAKLVTVRTLLAVVVKRNWSIQQLDVNNAFLHGDLDEKVYMKIPQGFSTGGKTKVCRLRKSLYGLKQASRNWYQKFTNALLELQFKQSKADHSLFILRQENVFIAALIYVDDVIIVGNDTNKIQETKEELDKRFSIKDLGNLKYFLGIEVTRVPEGLVLSQRKYILDIFDDCGMQGCRPCSFPIEQNLKLDKGEKDPKIDASQYRRIIGRLLYLQATRPDIAYTVNLLSQFVADPRQPHMTAAVRVLRYLKTTPGQGVLLPRAGGSNLLAYCDSDWLGCPLTRRSRTGYVLLLGGAPISWKTKKQSVVSRSSAEVEYRSMATTVSEVLWVRWLLTELDENIIGPTPLFCDNQVARHIATNPVFHERTKHVEMDCFFVRERVDTKEIVPCSVDTKLQIADLLTKGLGTQQLQFFLGKLGARNLHAPT